MKSIYILTLVLFFISCGDRYRNEVVEKYSNGQTKEEREYTTISNWFSKSITYNSQITYYWENGNDKQYLFLEENGDVWGDYYYSEDGYSGYEKTSVDGKKFSHDIFDKYSLIEYSFFEDGLGMIYYTSYDESGDMLDLHIFTKDERTGKWDTDGVESIFDYCYKRRPSNE